MYLKNFVCLVLNGIHPKCKAALVVWMEQAQQDPVMEMLEVTAQD